MIFLKVMRTGQDTEDFILGADLITIGSAPDCSVRLVADDLPARHATIETSVRTSTSRVTALGDPTPAKVTLNGALVTSAQLENGDVIGIGNYSLVYFQSHGGYDGSIDTKTWKVPSISTARK